MFQKPSPAQYYSIFVEKRLSRNCNRENISHYYFNSIDFN